jgi:hypothetical protein
MHIEKNIFENVFNMIIEVKGKTKDTIKVRMNVTLFCDFKNMELLNDEVRVVKPKTTFALDKKKKHNFLYANDLRVCDFLMNML